MTNPKPSIEHRRRVKSELIKAGVSRYGLLKMESRHLPEFIHPDEHIEAVAYGIHETYSAMIVATDRRVLYLDRKPFYTIADELTYEMVAGVGYNLVGNRAEVVLHTRLGDYTLRFVNRRAAEKFVHYIEVRRVEAARTETGATQQNLADQYSPEFLHEPLTEDGIKFLHQRHTATLSTVDRNGNVHGAVVYYFVDANNTIYVLTKSDTKKARNVLSNHQIAFTVYDAKHAITLQLQGLAEFEPDKGVRDFVFHQLTQPRSYAGQKENPPVTKLSNGSFSVIRIKPTAAVFHDFNNPG